MQENVARANSSRAIPFDAAKLDQLMEAAGLDVLVATSKHNVQYLLGAERAIFFDYMDAMGVSRYLPVLIYPKGAPEKAVYIGHRLETHQRECTPFWTPRCRTTPMARSTPCSAPADYPQGRRALEADRRRDGVPADGCRKALADALPEARSRTRCSCWSGCGRSSGRRAGQAAGPPPSWSIDRCWR